MISYWKLSLKSKKRSFIFTTRKSTENYQYCCFVLFVRILIFCRTEIHLAKAFRKKEEKTIVVFDVYVSKKYDKAWLLDFSPIGVTTEPLLFSWEEYEESKIQQFVHRKRKDQKMPFILSRRITWLRLGSSQWPRRVCEKGWFLKILCILSQCY